VHVTNEAPSGATMRHLCLACADLEQTDGTPRERYLNYGAILICVGGIVTMLSLLADELKFGDSEGFGPKQELGVGVALVFVFTAALVRIPTLLVIGILAGALTILADIFQFGHEDGFGWSQLLGTAVGLTLAACGWLEARRQG
jgi:hypothetical protein